MIFLFKDHSLKLNRQIVIINKLNIDFNSLLI